MISLPPVPPGIPGAAVTKAHQDAIVQLQSPQSPTREAALDFADLPPAANWKNCRVIVSDKACLAISVPQGAGYAWVRADGSAL